MKLVNYKLQNQIEHLSELKTNANFKEYIKSILEDTNISYFKRADYIGLSLNEIKAKIDSLSEDIKQLQAYKKKLNSALDIAKVQIADIFNQNGINRIDGNIISSLTVSNPTNKIKQKLIIKNEQALLNLGYVKFSVDEEAILKAIKNKDNYKEIEEYITLDIQEEKVPSKLKVNNKKDVSALDTPSNELLVLDSKNVA